MTTLLLRRGRTPSNPPSQNRVKDWDLLPVAMLLWVGSAARVALGLSSGEVFGVEATLALACVFLVPWLLISRKLEVARAATFSRAKVTHAEKTQHTVAVAADYEF